MKILLQSTLFYPSVGGIETVSQCLAERYFELGHTCTVLTRSNSDKQESFLFQVVRRPSFFEKKRLVQSHDIVHCNGASLELILLAKFFRKPIVWTHAGYQVVSIDGLGWYEGEVSPLSPYSSFLFHLKKQGVIRAAVLFLKLLLRRFASLFIDRHVAITQWVARRQPFLNQIVIYNPFPINRFTSIRDKTDFEYDFFYLGRMVSEKGVSTLLEAFVKFLESRPNYSKKLLLIGDGSWRLNLEKLAINLGVFEKVDFVGKQTGDRLLQYVSKGKIAIIPSEWEEPMGGVALEMLAAGKPVIVSKNGGLAECVGEAGLTFSNGDSSALHKQMELLYLDGDLQNKLKRNAQDQILKFDELSLTKQYVSLFESLIKK